MPVAECTRLLHEPVAVEVAHSFHDIAHGAASVNCSCVRMTLAPGGCIRRFLLHVLPGALARVREFGFLAGRGREMNLTRIRELLDCPEPDPTPPPRKTGPLTTCRTGVDTTRRPACRADCLVVLGRVSSQLKVVLRAGGPLAAHNSLCAALVAHPESSPLAGPFCCPVPPASFDAPIRSFPPRPPL